MGVDHRRLDALVPEVLLDFTDVAGQVTLVHEVALSRILPNLMEVNGLKCTHTATS